MSTKSSARGNLPDIDFELVTEAGIEVSDTYWTQWTAAGGPFPPPGFPLERAWAKTVKGELN